MGRSKKSIASHKSQISRRNRFANCSISSDQNSKILQLANERHIRNPFLLFLDVFRSQQKHKISAFDNTTYAARKWNRMTLKERYPYIEAARKTDYVFKSKNERVTSLIQHLRNVLPDEQTIKPELLPIAITQLRDWQREIINEILGNT